MRYMQRVAFFFIFKDRTKDSHEMETPECKCNHENENSFNVA